MRCKICLAREGKYTCPRCHLVYCSLGCYQDRKHEACSEKFYEESVLNELKQNSASDAEKKLMLEMLRQFEEDCAEDGEALRDRERIDNLASRMDGLDLDSETQKIWQRLNREEREDFLKLVREQKFSEIVHEWVPWWVYQENKKPLVTELTDESEEDEQDDLSAFNFPEINTKLQEFTSVMSTPPSPQLKFNTVNILCAYVYTVTRYNGEHQHMALQCAEDMISMSSVLMEKSVCKSTAEAIEFYLQSLRKLSDLHINLEHSCAALDHVISVIHGPKEATPTDDYLLMAISDVLLLIKCARKELLKESDSADGCRKLKLMERKVHFYASWILSHGLEGLLPLQSEILLERDKIMASKSEAAENEKRVKDLKEQQKKPKIEELI